MANEEGHLRMAEVEVRMYFTTSGGETSSSSLVGN